MKIQYVSPNQRKTSTSTQTALDQANRGPFVDTHCHLDMIFEFEKQKNKKNLDIKTELSQYIDNNFSQNFVGCIHVCCSLESIENSVHIINNHEQIYGAFGLHPHDAKYYTDEAEKRYEEIMSNPKCVAWGECGLDYCKNKSPKEVQQDVFVRQMKKAVLHNKPLVVHTRDAEDDTYKLMTETLPPSHRIHIHCFTGTSEFIQKIFAFFPNSFVGFTGAVSFRKASELREVVSKIPLQRILLETDGPFMAPEPYRGKVAHCGHIPLVATQIADLHFVSVEEVLKSCLENAQKMYGCFH
eukprot:TRINITY_DN13156_c0_g1_i1.p1 TRINITY_DN13156_c0_g1~~TRINITY_DN13156_c0_g1_i1.p1  ORF type:complete len:323 (+),score=45.46 TRINITY_DN13156_c0_g1_i1:78-971(+)